MSAGSPIKNLKRMRIVTLALSFLGIGLCAYSVYVSYRKEANNEYKAYCDIKENISCSKVFTSKYGKGFGFLGALLGNDSPAVVSNGIYGIVIYSLVALLGESTSVAAAHIQRVIVLLTNVMSVYLAYILYFVLKDMCVVCIATYVINFLLAICCFVRVNSINSLKGKKKGASKSAATKTQADNKNQASNKKQKNKSNPNSAKNSPVSNKENNKNAQNKTNQNKSSQNITKNTVPNSTKSQANGQIANKNANSNKASNATKNNQNANKINTSSKKKKNQ